MIDPTQIPKPIVDLAKEAASKPAAGFSEFISLKLFGKTNAKLRAEAENEYEKKKQAGRIARQADEPFLIRMETERAHRQYTNLGNILLKSTPMVVAPTSAIDNDNDVFWGLLEHAKNISSETMQDLVAKIIAGEYNAPGTYAMSTLQVLKTLGKFELELFERIAGLIISNRIIPKKLFFTGENNKFAMQNLHVDFGSLQTLQSLGLILPNDMTMTTSKTVKNSFYLRYFDKKLIFRPENKKYQEIRLPNYYSPSPAGQQILRHLNPQFNEMYFQWLINNYKIPHYEIEKDTVSSKSS